MRGGGSFGELGLSLRLSIWAKSLDYSDDAGLAMLGGSLLEDY